MILVLLPLLVLVSNAHSQDSGSLGTWAQILDLVLIVLLPKTDGWLQANRALPNHHSHLDEGQDMGGQTVGEAP
jgi:hypothetical protein